jgi:hypothetical protein
MDVFDDGIVEIWRVFEKHNLQYIMVGGFAVNLHGFNRTTGDLDIWIKDEAENRNKFRQVLIDLKYADLPQIHSLDFAPRSTTFLLDNGIEFDVMTYLKGFEKEKFDFCFEYASICKILELDIPFLNINHLLEAKKATFRPKDQIDILELEKIKQNRI